MGKRQGKQSNAKLVFENIENARGGDLLEGMRGCVSQRSTCVVILFFSSHMAFSKKALHFPESWEKKGLDLAGARAPRECSG